ERRPPPGRWSKSHVESISYWLGNRLAMLAKGLSRKHLTQQTQHQLRKVPDYRFLGVPGHRNHHRRALCTNFGAIGPALKKGCGLDEAQVACAKFRRVTIWAA